METETEIETEKYFKTEITLTHGYRKQLGWAKGGMGLPV